MIKAENIEKSYNGEKVLRGVNLEIKDGEFVAIMGESGSGKSTLISILGGFLEQDLGRVLWDGRDISELSERELSRLRSTEVGFVFQFFKPVKPSRRTPYFVDFGKHGVDFPRKFLSEAGGCAGDDGNIFLISH